MIVKLKKLKKNIITASINIFYTTTNMPCNGKCEGNSFYSLDGKETILCTCKKTCPCKTMSLKMFKKNFMTFETSE